MLSTTERLWSSGLLRTTERFVCEPVTMEISEKIKKAREGKGWSQRDLADKMGVSNSAVAQWELGQTVPKMANRHDLSVKLGIPFIDLLPELTVAGKASEEDREILMLVQQLLELPRRVRRVLLMTAVETAAEIRGSGRPE